LACPQAVLRYAADRAPDGRNRLPSRNRRDRCGFALLQSEPLDWIYSGTQTTPNGRSAFESAAFVSVIGRRARQ